MPLLVWFSIENDSLLIAPQKPQVPATVSTIKRKLPGTLFVSPWQSISSGGGGGSRTRVPTRIDEDIYMLVPSSIVFRLPFRQWTGNPSEQALFNLVQTPNAGSPDQGTGWRRLYLSTQSGTATWRDYAARANSSFAFIVLTGDLRGQRSSSACNQPNSFAGRIRNTPGTHRDGSLLPLFLI